ncbi:unnamed protein product, partial [Meganyctiphanes norvegica]
MKRIILLLGVLLSIQGCFGHTESDCTEVGYARAAGNTLHQGYQVAKDNLLATWMNEDINDKETKYTQLSPILKNVTRAAQLLEASTKQIVGVIRKTRVGKRCREAWLLKGVEKHVVPLVNLDKELTEELGLVMSFRCVVGSPYPNVDGTCINQESPDLGSIGSKFLRLQPANSGKDACVPHDISWDQKATNVTEGIKRHIKKQILRSVHENVIFTSNHMTFILQESPLAESIDCCKNDAEDCFPVKVDENDPIYKELPCIDFKRSARAQAILGRDRTSLISTTIKVYSYGRSNGSGMAISNGYLIFYGPEGVEETEGDKKSDEKKPAKEVKCAAPESLEGCFQLSPEEEKTMLESLRLLLVLEHNRIADALAEVNPHFDDSLLYNEARRLLIAEYNMITYNEYLPTLLGEAIVTKHSLLPGTEGPGAQYIKEVNPGILTNFALASYRNAAMKSEWRNSWGATDILDSTQYNSVLKDSYQDLLALDMQRARDHGVTGYIHWRRFCDQGAANNNFEDLESNIHKEAVAALKELYDGELDDLDLSVALLEATEEGAAVGKTFSCLLADQYARLKTGNRLFWEHESSLVTAEQRDLMRTEVSLARLLCNNLPVHAVPKNAFLPPSDTNPLVECSTLPPMNMEHWKDTSLIEKMKEINDQKESEKKEKTRDESEL